MFQSKIKVSTISSIYKYTTYHWASVSTITIRWIILHNTIASIFIVIIIILDIRPKSYILNYLVFNITKSNVTCVNKINRRISKRLTNN